MKLFTILFFLIFFTALGFSVNPKVTVNMSLSGDWSYSKQYVGNSSFGENYISIGNYLWYDNYGSPINATVYGSCNITVTSTYVSMSVGLSSSSGSVVGGASKVAYFATEKSGVISVPSAGNGASGHPVWHSNASISWSVEDNAAPVWQGANPLTVEIRAGANGVFDISNFSNNPTSYSFNMVPASGVTLLLNSNGTMILVKTISDASNGTYSGIFSASNQYGTSDSIPAKLIISADAPDPLGLNFTSSSTISIVGGGTVNHKLTTNRDSEGVSISVSSLPSWLVFNPVTKMITGIAPDGKSSFTVLANAALLDGADTASQTIYGTVFASSAVPPSTDTSVSNDTPGQTALNNWNGISSTDFATNTNNSLNKLNSTADKISLRLTNMDVSLQQMNQSATNIDNKLSATNSKLDTVNTSVGGVKTSVDAVKSSIDSAKASTDLSNTKLDQIKQSIDSAKASNSSENNEIKSSILAVKSAIENQASGGGTTVDMTATNTILSDIRTAVSSPSTVDMSGEETPDLNVADMASSHPVKVDFIKNQLNKTYANSPPVFTIPFSSIKVGEYDPFPDLVLDFGDEVLLNFVHAMRIFFLGCVVIWAFITVIKIIRSFEY